jgi:hypothetical protein
LLQLQCKRAHAGRAVAWIGAKIERDRIAQEIENLRIGAVPAASRTDDRLSDQAAVRCPGASGGDTTASPIGALRFRR